MKDDRKIDVIGLYGGTRKTHGYGESRNRVLGGDGITQSLSATDYKEPIRTAIPVLTPDRIHKRQNGRRFKEEGDDMFTLTSIDRHGVAVIAGLGEKKSNGGSQFYQQDRVYDGEGTATSLNSQLPGGGQMYGIKPQENVDTIYYPKGDCQIAIRKLTPKECFRLQAVPDELFERAKFVNSDAQLYKQAGNAVTATVVYELAKKLTKGQK